MSTRQTHSLIALLGLLALVFALAQWLPISDRIIPANIFLALHLSVEVFAITVAVMVFAVTWNAPGSRLPAHLALLGSGFLAVGLLDLLHTLSYPGMPDLVTPASADKAISFWLAARVMTGAALLVLAVLPVTTALHPRLGAYALGGALTIVATVAALVLGAEELPRFFVEGEGLTSVKVGVEVAICALYAATGALLWRRADTHPGIVNWKLLAAAAWILALSELFFASYVSVTDSYNAAGHVYKAIAYAMIFRAVFVVAIRSPYAQLMEARSRAAASDSRYESILATAMDGIIVLDEQQRIVLFNTAAERIFRVAANQMIGRPLDDLLPEGARATHGALIDKFAGNGTANRRMAAGRDVQGRRADGELFPAEISISRTTGPGRSYMTAIVRDVSARVRAEQARAEAQRELERVNAELRAEIAQRRETQERLAEVMDLNERIVPAAPLGIVAYRATGPCVFANDAIATIIGATPEQVRAQNFRELASWRDSGLLAQAERVLATRQPERAEFKITSSFGRELWLECAMAPFSSGGEDHLLLLVSDTTARKNAELALRAAHEQSERASRAKSDFLARMSHELRTPMNAILGFAQILQFDELLPAQQEHVEEIHKAGKHLLTLIDELLDLSRIEHGRINIVIAPTYLGVVVQDALTLVEPLIRERHIAVHNLTADAARHLVNADATRLKQILVNLLTNAAKYNVTGGRIEISVRETPTHVRVCITDTGPGIPAEKQHLLFTPFSRLGAEYSATEGAGIGLALSKKLAELMNATLGVDSEPNKGSTFWIELPRADIGTRAPSEPTPIDDDDAYTHKVLYIEDNSANVRVVETMLRREPGVRVIVAMDGETGLELASRHRPHAVLVDLHLPDIDGFTVHRRLRAWDSMRDVPVIAISADAMPQDIERAKVAGFFDYVTKPIQMDDLLRAVRRALDARRPS